jgi:putative oxidoreductase
MKLPRSLLRFDRDVIEFTHRHGIPILRVALGILFVWFGLLKVLGYSPVAGLVVKTAYFLSPDVALIGMGVLETLIGIGLLAGVAMRAVLFMFFLQMCSTFLTLVTRPDLLFENGNPFVLSVYGEFLAKNIVLIAAGLVIVGSVPKKRESTST